MTFGEQKLDCEKTEIIFEAHPRICFSPGLWLEKKPMLAILGVLFSLLVATSQTFYAIDLHCDKIVLASAFSD